MSSSPRHLPIVCLAFATLALAASPAVDAAPTIAKPVKGTTTTFSASKLRQVVKAPAPLKSAKLLAKINAQLISLKQPPLSEAPQELEMRLTPITPRLENGAQFSEAANVHYAGSVPEAPTGAFGLQPSSSVKLSFPTVPGKFHIADCRAQMMGMWSTVAEAQLQVSGSDLPYKVEETIDGHLVLAFKATKSTSTIQLAWPDDLEGGLKVIAFYGCDFGKMG